ncbi:MAG: archease [Candidatus Woesearchaeota archaeon]|nr:archease [Candidatus Woesearchaeota archaeon]
MEKYKFFEHTADAKFQAYGKTLEEAFSNAALAMFSVMTDIKKIKPKIKKEISVEGIDQKQLLYNFLEEFLFLMDTEFLLLSNVEKIKINANKLTATAFFDKAENYETHGDVKAVTYQEMEINQEKDKVMVQVVVDI